MYKELKAIDNIIECRAKLCRMILENEYPTNGVIEVIELLSKSTNMIIESVEDSIKEKENWLEE